MGKFIGWDVATSAPATCSNCGMHKENKSGCCNDKHAVLNVKKDQLAATINNIPNNNFIFIQPAYLVYVNSALFSDVDIQTTFSSPPLINSGSSFIHNCVFRI